MAKETRKKKKKVLVLINLTYVKEADSGARKAAFDYIMDLDFDKFAVFGANSYMQIVANLVMHATTKEDKIRLFTTKDEAKEWLQSE